MISVQTKRYLLPALVVFGCTCAAAEDKTTKVEAKRLTATAQELEGKNSLVEARTAYLRSLGVLRSGDAEKGLERVRKASAVQARTLFDQAAHDSSQSQALLEKAHELDPANTAVSLKLAQAEIADGHRSQAAALLATLSGGSRDPAQRIQFEQLRSVALDGTRSGPLAVASGPASLANFNLALLSDTHRELDEDDATPGTSLCRQLQAIPTSLSTSPAVHLDRAFCAESTSRFDEARTELDAYIHLAPNALDVSDMLRHRELLSAILSLPAADSAKLQSLYAVAWTAARNRRYDQVDAAFLEAARTVPEFPESLRQRALLAEARGDSAEANRRWEQLAKSPSATAALREEAETAITRLPAEQKDYQELNDHAQQTLASLLTRKYLVGEDLSHPWVLSELADADKDLERAGRIFPLCPALHELRSLVASQTNDFGAMRESIETLRSSDSAIYFYGIVYDKQLHKKKELERKSRRLVKIEVEHGVLRVADLARFKGAHRAAASSATIDGATATSALATEDSLSDAEFTGFSVPLENVKKIETRNEFVYLELTGKDVKEKHLYLEPLHLAIDVPFEGPGARRYANNYARLLIRYGGFDTAKLGKESMTFSEKVSMTESFLSLGYEAFAMDPIGGLQTGRMLIRQISSMRGKVDRVELASDAMSMGLEPRAIPAETTAPPPSTSSVAAR